MMGMPSRPWSICRHWTADPTRDHNTGIVNQYIESAELLHCIGHQTSDLALPGDICKPHRQFAGRQGGFLSAPLFLRVPCQHYRGPFSGEAPDGGRVYAGCSTGDNYPLSLNRVILTSRHISPAHARESQDRIRRLACAKRAACPALHHAEYPADLGNIGAVLQYFVFHCRRHALK